MAERLFECSVGYRTVVILFIVLLCLSPQRTRAQQPTASLNASTAEVSCGGKARLKWSSTSAVAGQISGFGDVGPSGERDVQPKNDTTYTFTAAGPGGTASASVTVKVNKAIEASFSISPAEVRYLKVGDRVEQQGSATLNWTTSSADSVSVDPFGSVGTAGTRTVQPTPSRAGPGPTDETLTYTLHATNSCGGLETRTASLHIVGSIESAVTEELPVFLDWPDFTFNWDIKRVLVKKPHETLGIIFDRMTTALSNSNISRWSVYADARDGFAVVGTLDEIDDSGKFIGGVGGAEPAPSSRGVSDSLEQLFKALFAAHPGRFRVVVLIVSAAPFAPNRARSATPEFMKERLAGGMTDLAPEVRKIVFPQYFCQALIYEFYRATPNDLPKVLSSDESKLSAVAHLAGAHLWTEEELGR